MIGGLIAGLISGGTSLLGSRLNQLSQRETNQAYLQGVRETNQANKELAQQQNEWNLDQWYRENEYNTPARQIERLKAAGLSSAAAAQAIEGTGNASQLQSADLANQQAAQPVQAPTFDLSSIPSLLGLIRESVELRKSASEAELKEKDVQSYNDRIFSEVDVNRAVSAMKQRELYERVKSWPYSFRAMKYTTAAAKSLPELRRLEVEQRKVDIEIAKQNFDLAKQQFGWLEKIHEQEFNEMIEKIRNLKKQYEVYQSQINKNNAETATEEQRKKLTEQQFISQGLDNILKEHGSPNSVAGRAGVMYSRGLISTDEMIDALKGTRYYLDRGYDVYDPDEVTKDFLHYVFDEGSSHASKLDARNLGGLVELSSSLPWFDLWKHR